MNRTEFIQRAAIAVLPAVVALEFDDPEAVAVSLAHRLCKRLEKSGAEYEY